MNRPAIHLIVALDSCHGIGKDNQLPWHLPKDLKRFKSLTMGHPLLMGRKTALSLGRALPGRVNWVLTRSGNVPFEGMQPIASVEEAIARTQDATELWILGGGEIFELTLPLADRLYLTLIDGDFDADRFFPTFDRSHFRQIELEVHEPTPQQPLRYTYETLERIRS